MPRLLQLDGTSLEELKARVLAEHGSRARVISVETVTRGGIGGFFGSRHYEVTVELPDLPSPTQLRDAHHLDVPTRIGIASLLEDADVQEAIVYNQVSSGFPVSTSSREFANIMDQLESATIPTPVGARPPLPSPPLLSAPGDLVAIVGIGDGPLTVATTMASIAGMAEVTVAGSLGTPGLSRVDSRRAAMVTRAHGVERGEPVFLAFGLTGVGEDAATEAYELAALHPDQVWAVVDATRKPEDTAHWVEELAAVVALDAVAGTNHDNTLSPETINELGLPATWAYNG
ncbi:MAG: hypothetical protein QOJ18_800 [Microbacteriaceae bacterium]|nr:hypothetical protein [Microbacteriaceae bacterium]